MFFKKVSNKEIAEFNRVLSLLLIAKLPLIDALKLIKNQTKSEYFREIQVKILEELKRGRTLSQCFEKFPTVFSKIYIANIKVGEETGNIAEVLAEYTEFQQKFYELKQKISMAFRYPAFVLSITVLAVLFMLLFLIPTFEALFRSMKNEIPPITQFLLDISGTMTEHYLTMLIGVGVSAFVGLRISKSEYFKREIGDLLIIKLPYFSDMFKKNLLSRFSLSMGLLLKNGVNLTEALSISSKISENSIFVGEISRMNKNLHKGQNIVSNITSSKLFDKTFSQLLAAGEESAELDKVFYMLSDFYGKEFDYKLKNLTSLIEPILILIIGSLVAVILVAMYLPMFELINFMGA